MNFLLSHWPFLLIVVLALLIWGRNVARPRPAPYKKRGSLVTEAELAFFRVLKEAVDGNWHIMAMVRMADLIEVKRDIQQRQNWVNRILAKHIDFVLCDPESLEARVAIELDDSSHEKPHRVERDKFVNKALSAAGLPLLRVTVEHNYSKEDLRKQIDSVA